MSEGPMGKDFCRCPYCDAELTEPTPLCGTCKIVLITCAHCGTVMREGLETCPACGENTGGQKGD